MQLTEKEISDFRLLYKSLFGTEITMDEARIIGLKLINSLALVYKPIKKTTTAFENRGVEKFLKPISKVQ